MAKKEKYRFQLTTEQLLKQYEREEYRPRVLLTGAKQRSVDIHLPNEPIQYEVVYATGYDVGDAYPVAFEEEMKSYAGAVDRPLHEQIHLVLYCIHAPHRRITAVDLRTIRLFQEKDFPILVVLTGAERVEEEIIEQFRRAFQHEQLPYMEMTDERSSVVPLYRWLNAHCEEGMKTRAEQLQFHDLEVAKKDVEKSIRRHVAAAFAVGFTPIPFADGPILLANQAKMLSKVLETYQLGSLASHIQSIIAALGVGELVSQFGRYLVAQIVKFIPGVGTVAGGVINGTVASAITISLGLTVSEMSYQAAKQKIVDPQLEIGTFFKETFSQETIRELFQGFLKVETERLKKKTDE